LPQDTSPQGTRSSKRHEPTEYERVDASSLFSVPIFDYSFEIYKDYVASLFWRGRRLAYGPGDLGIGVGTTSGRRKWRAASRTNGTSCTHCLDRRWPGIGQLAFVPGRA
jgi:hypothetical protein